MHNKSYPSQLVSQIRKLIKEVQAPFSLHCLRDHRRKSLIDVSSIMRINIFLFFYFCKIDILRDLKSVNFILKKNQIVRKYYLFPHVWKPFKQIGEGGATDSYFILTCHTHRHHIKKGWLMACTTCLVCLVSTASGCRKNTLGRLSACSGHITRAFAIAFVLWDWNFWNSKETKMVQKNFESALTIARNYKIQQK